MQPTADGKGGTGTSVTHGGEYFGHVVESPSIDISQKAVDIDVRQSTLHTAITDFS